VDRHAGLVPDPLVQPAQQGASAGEHDAAVHDVAGQLRRGLVEGDPHRVHDRVQRLLQRLAHLGAGDRHRARQPGDHVAAADLGLGLVELGERRAEGHLDLLGGALAEHQRVLLLHPGHDRPVEVVAGGAHREAGDDAAEGDDRDLGGAAADVDDHVAGGLVHRQTGADRGGHRLLDDVDLTGAGLVAALLDRALLDRRDAAGHADHHARLGEVAAAVHLLDEVAQHLLGRLEVGDHPAQERPDGGDVVGGAPDHPLRLETHGEDLAGGLLQRDDAGLVEQDALAAHVDERVGGAEVHGHVAADEAVGPGEAVCHGSPSVQRTARRRPGRADPWCWWGRSDPRLRSPGPTAAQDTRPDLRFAGQTSGNQRASSRAADSGESEACTRFSRLESE